MVCPSLFGKDYVMSLFEKRVEAAAVELAGGRKHFYEYPNNEDDRDTYRADARAALRAADAVVKRVDEAGNEHQKCLGCGRYVDECCLTPAERRARARAKGVEFVKEVDAVVTEEQLASAIDEGLNEARDMRARGEIPPFSPAEVAAKVALALFRGGAK